jgi:hypothetical protein
MFYILASALCLAVLFLVLVIGSLLFMPATRLLNKVLPAATPGAKANLLFAVRLLPAALA